MKSLEQKPEESGDWCDPDRDVAQRQTVRRSFQPRLHLSPIEKSSALSCYVTAQFVGAISLLALATFVLPDTPATDAVCYAETINLASMQRCGLRR